MLYKVFWRESAWWWCDLLQKRTIFQFLNHEALNNIEENIQRYFKLENITNLYFLGWLQSAKRGGEVL